MGSSRFCNFVFKVVLLALLSRHVFSQDNRVIIDGDVTLAAMFPVQALEQGTCGKYDVLSMQSIVGVVWFLQALNRMNYLPGVTLGLDVYRTCNKVDKAREGAVKLMNRYEVMADSGAQPSIGSVLFGMLGPERTSEAIAVSSLISSLPTGQRLLQISASATGKQLSNSAMFPSFFRVIPPDETQVKVILELLLQLQWNYVAIVYDDDDYGRSAAMELRQLAEGRQLCIPLFASLPIDTRLVAFATKAKEIATQLKSPENGIVRGLVILGGRSTTQSLLEVLSTEVSYVTIILSEAVALQRDALLSSSGKLYDLVRGAMVTTPPYLDIPELTTTWNELWTNYTVFERHSSINPWMGEYFQQLAKCLHNASGCWNSVASLRTSQMAVEGRELSLFISYQVKAVAVMAALLKRLLPNTPPCSLRTEACSELRQALSQRQTILDTLRRTSLDLSAFSSVSSVFSSMTSVTFNNSTGDIENGKTEEEYTVFNFRQTDGGGNFKFTQIGSWVDVHLTINTSRARFYAETGQPLTWSELPPAQCADNVDCLKCQHDVSQDIIFLEGDFYMVGIVPASDRNPNDVLLCGPVKPLVGADIAQSLVFAVEQINQKKRDFADVLPGRKVGLIVINSCSSKMIVKKRLIDIYSGDQPLPGNRNSSILAKKIMGCVGAFYSDNSIAAAETLNDLQRPFVQVSGASTSPLLSDKSRFPYFLRLPAPDDKQTQALLAIIQSLGANYIQVIYDGSTTYASGLFLLLNQTIQNNAYNICIAQSIVTTPKTDISQYFWVKDKLREKYAARVVIVILHHLEVQKVMSAILPKLNPEEFMFIASESWGRRQDLINGDSRFKLAGSLVLSQEIVSNQLFSEYFHNLQPDMSSNPWLAAFWETKLGCFFSKSFTRKGKSPCPQDFARSYMQDLRVPFHIQVVNALALGFHAALSRVCGVNAMTVCQQLTSANLFDEMLKVKLDLYGTDQDIQVFDSKGDGLVGYKVLQIEPDTSTPSSEDLKYSEVGSWTLDRLTLETSRLTLSNKPTFRSICPDNECPRCFPSPESVCPSQCDACVHSNRDKECNNNQVSLAAFIGVVIALILIISGLVIIVVVRHRQIKVLKEAACRRKDIQTSYYYNRSLSDSDYTTIGANTARPSDTPPPPRPCQPQKDTVDYIHPISNQPDMLQTVTL